MMNDVLLNFSAGAIEVVVPLLIYRLYAKRKETRVFLLSAIGAVMPLLLVHSAVSLLFIVGLHADIIFPFYALWGKNIALYLGLLLVGLGVGFAFFRRASVMRAFWVGAIAASLICTVVLAVQVIVRS